jgi:HAD superfamily hydrolase (TIGR01450 family)
MSNKGAIIDLDGTVYRGGAPIDGAAEAIQTLRDDGFRLLFLTNAAVRSRQSYSEKLTELGIQASPEEILTSGVVTAEYLSHNRPQCTPLVIGEEPLTDELRRVGLEPTSDPDAADVLVASLDRNISYDSLTLALRTLDSDTLFVATNPDATRPGEDGELPSTGAIIGAIHGMTDRDPDIIPGKPSEETANVALRLLDISPRECLLVGDRLDTDIKMGQSLGIPTVLVLSGVTTESELRDADVSPDHVLDSLQDIDDVL